MRGCNYGLIKMATLIEARCCYSLMGRSPSMRANPDSHHVGCSLLAEDLLRDSYRSPGGPLPTGAVRAPPIQTFGGVDTQDVFPQWSGKPKRANAALRAAVGASHHVSVRVKHRVDWEGQGGKPWSVQVIIVSVLGLLDWELLLLTNDWLDEILDTFGELTGCPISAKRRRIVAW